jgi:REP-associated tyrosine transposase
MMKSTFCTIPTGLFAGHLASYLSTIRSSRRFAAVRASFAAARGKHGLRLVHFTVLNNHLHLVVEADSSESLSRGMQGLCVRLARALNGVLHRAGGLFADHYHCHLLVTPTEVARALSYVLSNAERHYGEAGLDACSSAVAHAREVLVPPRGWLLSVGWQRGRTKAPLNVATIRWWDQR